MIGILVYAVWRYLINVAGLDTPTAQGIVLCLMTFMQNVHAFSCRSEHQSVFKIPFKNNPMIVIGVAAVICLQSI